MNILERDISFQNNSVTLRVAPWLDMPRLRHKMQEDIAEKVESGNYDAHYPQFKRDLLSFCEGEYRRAPHSMDIIDALSACLFTEFCEYRRDGRRSRALSHISAYLLQHHLWSTNNTLESEPDIPF